MIPIPEDVQKEIVDCAKEYASNNANDNRYGDFRIVANSYRDGATFGFNLAAPLLEEKEREIERLKGLIRVQFNSYRDTDTINETWAEYCKLNNL